MHKLLRPGLATVYTYIPFFEFHRVGELLRGDWFRSAWRYFSQVFKNPQPGTLIERTKFAEAEPAKLSIENRETES